MMRSKQATPDERRASFDWCLDQALSGNYPPTETGLFPETIYALQAVADAALQDKPTYELEELKEQARFAMNVELRGPVYPA
jgi:hypothetical protein